MILFMVSDSLLGFNRFVRPMPIAEPWIMVSCACTVPDRRWVRCTRARPGQYPAKSCAGGLADPAPCSLILHLLAQYPGGACIFGFA
ncbi:MAG: hypothetical protein IPG74_18610 [Flavobacteriales bacterium]|nr:hypothetical protein [Flavobacteriales bacterium]